MNDFLDRHADAEHELFATLREAVRTGACEVPDPLRWPLDDSFVSNYRFRLKRLARLSSPHARQLREGVEAWLQAAADQPGRVVLYWRFPFPNGREHTVIESASTHRVLAVFTTVSKLEVSEDEWAELWGPEGPMEES